MFSRVVPFLPSPTVSSPCKRLFRLGALVAAGLVMGVMAYFTLNPVAQGNTPEPKTPFEQDIRELKVNLPADAARFIDRRVGCNHWWGEEPFDSERAQEISRALEHFRCERLEKDEQALFKKYKDSARVIQALKKAQRL